MTDLQFDHFLYLVYSPTHYYQSRGLPLAHATTMYGDPRARYQTLRRFFLVKDCTETTTLMMLAAFSQSKPDHFRYYYYALKTLFYSLRLNRSFSILHKSRDGF